MKSFRARGIWVALFGVLSLLVALQASAECENGGPSGAGVQTGKSGSGRGVGGTGRSEGPGTGTGGTGVVGDPDEDSGTGTGGTGILGVVTGFGSICVNETKVEYDAETRIYVDGREGSQADLAVGQLARITTRSNQPRHAAEIRVQHVLVGPIDRVDATDRSVWVMGNRVELPTSRWSESEGAAGVARDAELRPGRSVAVSGFRRADGGIAATRVVESGDFRGATVTAMASGDADGTLRVGGLRVEVPESDLAQARQLVGQRVRVSGEWNGETRSVERARVERESSIARGVRNVSIQGYVSDREGTNSLRIDDVEVRATAAVLPKEALSIDTRVRVEGALDASGRVRADRIYVEETRPQGRDARSSAEAVDDSRSSGKRRDGSDRSDRSERSGRSERSERNERSDRPERPERSGRSERPERAGR